MLGRQCAERFSKVLIPGRGANLPPAQVGWIPAQVLAPARAQPARGPRSPPLPLTTQCIHAPPPLRLAATVSSAKAPPHQGCGKLILPAAWPGPASPLVPGWLWRHTTDLVLFIVHLPLRPGHGRAFVTTCQVELNACLPQNTEETNVYSACTS